jgi:sarcosine oxidase
MNRSFDVIVGGLGAMGSSALSHLAGRGIKVLGVDRHSPPHSLGSTHGNSRVIREAYYEHPLYVPLVRRAFENWRQLEEESGRSIYHRTGGIMLGRPDGPVISGSLVSAVEHGIAHSLLTADEVRSRLPGFAPPDDFIGLWEERAGYIEPETAIAANLELAARHGAEIRAGMTLLRWEADAGGVHVETTEGTRLDGGILVLSVGAWISKLLGSVGQAFEVERQLSHWFRPEVDIRGWPVALWEHRPGGLLYTIPEAGGRVKGGIHHEGQIVDPDTLDREITPEEDTKVRALVQRYQPGATGPLLAKAVCLYTNTPDRHFVVDWHPDHDNVLIVSPCSGHGFKFASAIGEIVADLVNARAPRFDLSPFTLARFAGDTP